jgi:hypothetical protein
VTLFSILAVSISVAMLILAYRKPKADHPVCTRCGYNLTGNTSGVCPECGAPVPPSASIVATS